ncbi:MAG: GTPase RsgA, partial [Propionibacteriaceae bacterium]
LGVPIVVTQQDLDPDVLRHELLGHVSVLVGHSGVGKSTLVNALVPGLDRAVGKVNDVTGRGRHTSTSAVAIELPDGQSWVIDTPGVRSFGLSHVTPDGVVAAFPDLAEITDDCPRGCQHIAQALDCALDTAVADAQLSPTRLASFRRIVDALVKARDHQYD